jgi:hypothetical protein
MWWSSARPRSERRHPKRTHSGRAESGTSAAEFAGQVLEHTRGRWGDLALALAPAYR